MLPIKMMKGLACVLFGIFVFVKAVHNEDRQVDPASRALFDFKRKHPDPKLLTTSAGKPVDIRETNTFNSELLTNAFFIDSIKHVVSERIPERVVFTKATGAHGYFEVTNDVTEYTKAKIFEKVGKKTRLFARASTSQIDKGGSDTTTLAIRSISFKFYTEEGNLDFLNIQLPVFTYRDPLLFPQALRAFKRNARTNLRDFTQVLDFLTLHPISIHAFLWLTSEFGLPKGFRHMNVFPIHTYEIYNEHGESFLVRFKFLAELGFQTISLQQAQTLSGEDPDFYVRDLYNAIEMKKYPAWRLEMDVLNEEHVRKGDFNPFDVTLLWPNGTYHTVSIGRIVLNKNIDNHFKDVEQSAFNPANLVPGIRGPLDMIFKGRVIAYSDAHIHRLGINHNKIEINCPMYAKTYNRDGPPPVLDNERDAPNYFPNSFNGPEPFVDESKHSRRIMPWEDYNVDLSQARRFYREVLAKESQKKRLIDNMVTLTLRVIHPIQEKYIELLTKVDKDLARRYSKALEIAKNNRNLPAVVEDIKPEGRDPYEL